MNESQNSSKTLELAKKHGLKIALCSAVILSSVAMGYWLLKPAGGSELTATSSGKKDEKGGPSWLNTEPEGITTQAAIGTMGSGKEVTVRFKVVSDKSLGGSKYAVNSAPFGSPGCLTVFTRDEACKTKLLGSKGKTITVKGVVTQYAKEGQTPVPEIVVESPDQILSVK